MTDQPQTVPLSQQVRSPSQLCDMSDDDLADLRTAHQTEIVEIKGRIDASTNEEWECERLRADAERYRWLREQAIWTDERDMGPGGLWAMYVSVRKRPADNTLDAAIDAACGGK